MELLTARIAVFRGILGLVVFPLFLMLTNTREHAESYRTLIMAMAIIVGSGVVAAAIEKR